MSFQGYFLRRVARPLAGVAILATFESSALDPARLPTAAATFEQGPTPSKISLKEKFEGFAPAKIVKVHIDY